MTDADRLRDLQHRAFAPGAALSDAESAELRTLTAQASAARSAQSSGTVSAGSAPTAHGAGSADGPHGVVAPGSGASSAPSGSEGKETPDATASGSHRRVGLSIVAAAATLLLGFGAGWLVFGRASGPQMSAEQQKTFAEIESSNEYDPGSLQFVGSEQELSVWQARDAEGEQRCIILTAGEQKEQTCIPSTEDLSAWSLQGSLSITGPDGTPKAAFWATILDDVNGNPVAAIQRHDMSDMGQFDWRDNFTGTERAIAEVIDSQGYDGEMLQVVGYDGETPIWLHDSTMPCVIRADAENLLMAICAEYSSDGVLEVQDNGVIYTLKQIENRGPLLTLTRTGTIPLDQGGEQLDDKTGDLVE